MIKYLNFFLLIYLTFINFIKLHLNTKKFLDENIELNFQYINFTLSEKLKKDFLSRKYLDNIPEVNNYLYHCFDWLGAAKDIGGYKSIKFSYEYIFFWHQKNYSFLSYAWNLEIASKRLINLIYYFDVYGQNLNKDKIKMLNKLIFKHYSFLKFNIKNKKESNFTLNTSKAYLILDFMLKNETRKITNIIIKQVKVLVDANGFHKSYNPAKQAEFINDLIEIKNIYLYFGKKEFKEIDFQILNMTSLLSNFYHKDNSLALFNGSNNFNIHLINKIINHSENVKIKKNYDPKNGIVIYSDKSKKIFFDITRPTNKILNDNLHAGTLSFEFSCLEEKIITNCGSVEKLSGNKPEYLRFSAAHSTIIINNTNVSELVKKKAYKRVPENILFAQSEDDENFYLQGSHDGYKINYSTIVKRKIAISKITDEIKGEDSIVSIKKNNVKNIYDIRFHLMPKCKCLLTNDKKSVIIKTPKNKSWVFNASSELTLENSIYIGNGTKIQQNQQIVITNFLKNIKQKEKWSLKKIL